jgi:outer membrane protein OmpA-like peptidoglycan-associated protein
MKDLNKFLFVVIMVLGINSNAQNSDNPWAISFGVNAVDTKASAGVGKNKLDSYFSQAFNVGENWNILPSISYIGIAKSVGNNFSVGLQGSVNKINKFVVYDPSLPNQNSKGYIVTNPGNLMYYAIDANVKYSFMSMIKSKVFDPSLRLGGGYTFLGETSFGSVNPGAGITIWFTENIGFAIETTYKVSQLFSGNRSTAANLYIPDSPSHFQHTAGLTFLFGGKDTDGDGIFDKNDACPDVAGLKQFNGCPDTDGDGIIDGSDACPTEFGLATLNGCPDKDSDGIADKDDACPNTAGLTAFRGCPDTDKDGIADKDDKCPTVAGPKSNGGCPILDTDKDGVLDKDDECPTVAGTVNNKGCPEVTEKVVEELKIQAKSVFFNSGKSTFKTGDTETIASLDAIKEILKSYPNAKWSIEGYTDSTGPDKLNQKLSEDRANAIKKVMIENGIKSENLTAVGFGKANPIATNKTKEGRAQNRRTEVKYLGSSEGKL